MKIIYLLFCVFLFTKVSAQQKSLMWEISGNGLKAPSYLYGTVHSADSRAFHFAKLAESFIAKCDAFGMEGKKRFVSKMRNYWMIASQAPLSRKVVSANRDDINSHQQLVLSRCASCSAYFT